MLAYRQHAAVRKTVTPQTEAIRGREADMSANNAGGFSFVLDDWARLDRFLILGSEGGTYYVGERKLTRDNAAAIERAIKADGPRVVRRVVEISDAGRAPKNDPALFVLAMAAGLGNDDTRKAALDALPKVARIGTHLFHFVEYVEGFRGWGRGLRRSVANWYLGMPPERLALQAVKYGQRDGWSHRDLLRLTHPLAGDMSKRALFDWIAHPEKPEAVSAVRGAFPLIDAVYGLKTSTTKEAARLIRKHSIPREAVPTEMLNSVEVWDALLAEMPMTAMIRNLGKMAAIGLVKPLSEAARHVADQLGDETALRKARVHPLALLMAEKTYAQGHGERGKLSWRPVPAVVDALDRAFYKAFKAVEPTGKRILLALDVSGSMDSGGIAGTSLTPREGAGAMVLVTAATESNHHIVGFTSGAANEWNSGARSRWGARLGNSGLSPIGISPRMRLDTVCEGMRNLPMGGTDCALPILYASANKIEADAFVIYTDNETWHGNIHPAEALRRYRDETGIAAKLIVVGMTATEFSIADPKDAGMLDVAGFDAGAPAVMADFIRG